MVTRAQDVEDPRRQMHQAWNKCHVFMYSSIRILYCNNGVLYWSTFWRQKCHAIGTSWLHFISLLILHHNFQCGLVYLINFPPDLYTRSESLYMTLLSLQRSYPIQATSHESRTLLNRLVLIQFIAIPGIGPSVQTTKSMEYPEIERERCPTPISSQHHWMF